MRATPRDDGTWFTVRDDASRAARVAAIRAALSAQRDRLERVEIDVLSDEEWPDEACAAVRVAEARLAAGRQRSTSLTLDPRSDEDLGLATVLAPHSIGGSATDDTGALVWDANDTGTSAAFRLTPSEVAAVRTAVERAGGGRDDVVTLASHHLGLRELGYDAVGDGHPVSGEEAFIVHRDDDGTVRLTLRALTRPGRGLWRALFPAILVAQRLYRRRYLRALLPTATSGDRRRPARG
ncbi:DUF1990 family protein [Isoptericola sp. NPDC057391]|uniref:DUF1990 family protein n=1 Tax=Isoptericola sp. NPDC057391 TaxID=3346117 RepID=UPI00363C14CD